MPSHIFISYRRDDTAAFAGRLCDRLSSRFGADHVFMDVEDIRPGQDFTRAIDEKIGSCDVVIAVIGPRWLATLRERQGEDFVREEIAAALKRGITVIPVLVGGTKVPAMSELPREFAKLSRLQAVEVRDAHFDDDVAELTDALRSGTRRPMWKWLVAGAAALAVLAVAAFLFTRPEAVDINGKWIAEMQKSGQRPFRIRLEFATAEDRVTGSVEYPTGDAAIRDGKINQRHLTFHTTHVPQFASEPATIRFEGEIMTDTIRLILTDDYGMARGVARRRGP